MRTRPTSGGDPAGADADRTGTVASALVLLVVGGLLVGLVGLVAAGRSALPGDGPSATGTGLPTPAPGAFLLATPAPAPPLALRDASGGTVDLAALRATPVLVFFGYTHCPDVCPTTIGVVGAAISTTGVPARALFVSVDPERDTPEWLAEFARFMPAGFTPITGTPAEVRTTADAWGIRYARVETGSADGYSMSHTADVFLVDRAGLIRARFPFGTEPEPMAALIAQVAGEPGTAATSPAVAPTASAGPTASTATGDLQPIVVSSSVWAGGESPVAIRLHDAAGPLDDPTIRATVQVLRSDGSRLGPVVTATPIQPPGLARVTHLATLDLPTSGTWRLRVTAYRDGTTSVGETTVEARDPGATAALGGTAPSVATPTLADVGGTIRAISTDLQPDPRLSSRSTTELIGSGTPFVLIVDSVRFKVTPACGKAVEVAKSLVDRWPGVGFVHLEPYRYSLITDSFVLDGELSDPPLVDTARAWGLGTGPWGATSVPWVFVVDGAGIVRAKYEGLVGSDDIDLVLTSLGAGR